MKKLILVLLLLGLTILTGCSHTLYGFSKDAHSLTGGMVDMTSGMSERKEVKDIEKEQIRLNNRISKLPSIGGK